MTAQQDRQLFIFAGEPSGDLHGAKLVRALKEIDPGIRIEGVAGNKMRAAGVTGPLKTEDFEVMGLSDVLASLPRLYKQFYKVLNFLLKNPPDAVVLIDYPGFNLRLAKHLKAKGYKGKIIQYISPSVWAWGKHRIDQMANTLDLLLTIYPFEASYYRQSSLNVQYVGSPIKELLSNYVYNETWKADLKIPSNLPIVGIFPGSRLQEIKRNLPVILKAANKLAKENAQVIFGISCSVPTFQKDLIACLSTHQELKGKVFIIPSQYNYELMRGSRFAIAKSGTVTLELALHKCPAVVVYKTSRLNRFYAKYILKAILKNYCIVNILAEKEIFPELIKETFNDEKLFQLIGPLHEDNNLRNVCIESCNALSVSLGTARASVNAAEAIAKLLS